METQKNQKKMMPGEYRQEKDSLGVVNVPSQALYGAQTLRAIENYPISNRVAHPALIRAYLRVKHAAATANEAGGAIEPAVAKAIRKAIDHLLKLTPVDWISIFPVDPYQAGAGTSQNMNINEVVANLANQQEGHPLGSYKMVNPNDHVNRSQSTNDSFPTAMRLAILEMAKGLVEQLTLTAEAFEKKAHAWKTIPKSARTHLQDAVPMTLGQEFAAYGLTLKKCAKWLEASRKELCELGIGGSAAGTGLTVPAGYKERMIQELSQLTQESLRSSPQLCEAMQSQAPVSHYSSMLRLTALELTRICNDLRLLASGPMTGLNEIFLPAVQPGSSIMPGKVNPSILEMANQTWYSVLGFDQTLAYCIQAGQLELNVMMPMMAYSMLEATHVATSSLSVLRTRCIEGLECNEVRVRKYFESTPQVATALSPKLGYQKTAEIVKESLALGTSVIELVRSRNLIPEPELNTLLDVEVLTGQK